MVQSGLDEARRGIHSRVSLIFVPFLNVISLKFGWVSQGGPWVRDGPGCRTGRSGHQARVSPAEDRKIIPPNMVQAF
eukprot:725759-Rhodomonas_salina.2